MIGVKQYLHRYSKESGPKVVFGDNSSGDTEGYGLVNCNGITFTRVAYVNGLKHNLINITQLTLKFCLQRLKEPYSTKMTMLSSLLLEEEMSMSLICHLTIKKAMLASFPRPHQVLISSGIRDYKNCSTFEKGKHHKASFKTKISFSINKCLHLLHMDLFGPVKPQTISHNKYTLVIIDEYSRKMENLNKVRVKELRSDNGTEFRNHNLEEFYDEKDHLGKFDEKADDGFFLGYSPVATKFRVFNIRRQEMEETYHVTFSEDDEAIYQSNTEGEAINFNENTSFPDDEFLEPRNKVTQCSGNI
ncbi:retrovirus-related pol polyprotein from transposon TNT 1-94, partial [Tanacetum coccineum]